MLIKCVQGWELGEQIGHGGFGRVFNATGEDGRHAAVKLVPKDPGAERELLFVSLEETSGIIPIWDHGEVDNFWAIVMPLAERSLAQEIQPNAPVAVDAAVQVLQDIAAALVGLTRQGVVHRDLKPDNILYFDERWCLADFGISRYAAASTALNTRRFAFTPPYAAPETWRHERSTPAVDIYAVGVIAYELLTGRRPFVGPSIEDYHEQHLQNNAPDLLGVPTRLASLIEECLYKAPEARPTPQQFAARLPQAASASRSPGASRLADAYRAESLREGERLREQSAARSEKERRQGLAEVARRSFDTISQELTELVTQQAPSVPIRRRQRGDWSVEIAEARLGLSVPQISATSWGGWQPPAFDVICHSIITVVIQPDRSGYRGRNHSLYYCDAEEKGVYGWYETAFMDSPLSGIQRSAQAPYALEPGELAAKALWSGMAERQVAWPFTRLIAGELDDFTDRWLGWFGAAVENQLSYPMLMPERSPQGSWRQG